MSENVNIRKAEKRDCGAILNLIKELAEYEEMLDQSNMTVETLERDGFDKDPPYFNALIAEESENVIGYAIFVHQYSTWNGRIMYLEDIYVSPSWRKKGVGISLLKMVNKISLESGCSQIRLACLKENHIGLDFYNTLGVKNLSELEGWLMLRFDMDQMKKLLM